MSQVSVGRWGKNLAILVPFEVARSSGRVDCEPGEIEAQDGDIGIRRTAAHAQARRDAAMAAEEILAESRRHELGEVSIRSLIEEGRRA